MWGVLASFSSLSSRMSNEDKLNHLFTASNVQSTSTIEREILFRSIIQVGNFQKSKNLN